MNELQAARSTWASLVSVLPDALINVAGLGLCHCRLASIYRDEDNMAQALDHFEKARKILAKSS